LRNGAARRALTGGGRTAVTRGRSPTRGRCSGGGKPVRRTLGRWGQMYGARAWTDEMNNAWGEKKILAGGRRLCFNGKRWGGGPEGWTRVEAERERERGRGRGALARHGVGAVAARPRRARAACCRATVENGGVGATRIDIADRWAGTLRGPDRQWLGAAWGSTVRRSARRGADRWGRQHSVPDSVFKPNQIYFKQIQICPKL
jgi:hypothetical protein